jgi:hypothetical protein
VRDRALAASPTLRKPEMLPPAEIEAALLSVVARNFGATEDQAATAVARALGFRAVSAQLRDTIRAVLRTAVDSGVLARRDTLINAGPNAPKRVSAPAAQPLAEMVSRGEGEQLEFKETLRWDVRLGAVSKRLEDAALKAIAAFANKHGGTLLIGVRDDGTVPGLGPDLASLGSRDKFDLHLTNLIKERLSPGFRAGCVSVSYPIHEGVLVCRVDVKRSRDPVYLYVADGNGPATERLVVRSGASSPEIPLGQVARYVRDHFDH